MEVAKIQFSPAEKDLMNNASVILTKNTVLQKVRSMFMELQADMQSASEHQAALMVPPKISRGENYLGLPYIILDYPRFFRQGEIMAIRTMFWWGHYFSITLHLSGSHKKTVVEKIEKGYTEFSSLDYFIAVHEDQWLHQFDKDVYRSVGTLDEVSFTAACRQFEHLKIGITVPLVEAGTAKERLLESWKFLLAKGLP